MTARFSVASPGGHDLPTDVVTYGPDVAREDTLKLLGHVEGKRVLDLGCGAGHNAIALARQGAKVIGVDESSDQVADARAACERERVKVELHHAPLAELAFIRADTIDAVLSVWGLAPVDDIDRVFRQVDRVLQAGAPAGAVDAPPRLRHGRPRRPRAAGAALLLGDRAAPTGTGAAHRSPSSFTSLGRGQLPRRHPARARARRHRPPQRRLARPHALRPGHPRRSAPASRAI